MKKLVIYLNYVRLAFFPLSYGIVGALMGSTLNRVMIADIGFRAAWVGLFFAVPDLVAPIRVWLGYRSDGFPILGRRREPYIILGVIVTSLSVVLVTRLATIGEVTNGLLILTILLAFVVFGIGRNLAHNSWQALLADKFHGDSRPRAVTAFEVLTVVGLILGAGVIGQMLGEYDAAQLLSVAVGLATITFLMTLLAVILQEPRTPTTEIATEQARAMPFSKVFKEIVWADKQVRLFFILIMFAFVGTLAQDVFLEPYGGLVLGMDVGATTQLTVFWGLGLIIGMLLSGIILIKWLGYMRVLRIGLIANMLVFIGIIVSGLGDNTALFRSLVLVMGFSTGLAGAGMLTIIINFTSYLRAGLLLGVWGVANQLGRALGSLMGGGVVDIMQGVTDGDAFLSYATVFALEVVMLLVAFVLSYRLNLQETKAQNEEQQVLERVAA